MKDYIRISLVILAAWLLGLGSYYYFIARADAIKADTKARQLQLEKETMRCHHGTREEETCPECTAEIVQLKADKAELIDVLKLLSEVDDPDKVITASWSANDWRQAKRQYNQTCLDTIAKHSKP